MYLHRLGLQRLLHHQLSCRHSPLLLFRWYQMSARSYQASADWRLPPCCFFVSAHNLSCCLIVDGTTLIFVLDGAQPGVPLPNSLDVTDIVVQGIPAPDIVVTDIEAEVEIDSNGTVEVALDINSTAELELDVNGTQSKEPDGSFCAVGPDGRSVQYVSGGTYVGPYRCTFETEDERGFIVLADLNLEVVLFVDPPDVEPLPPKPKPPTPKPVAKPSWGGGYPQTSKP